MQASGPAVKAKKVVPQGSHPEADRIDKDGLPVVGTVLYPSQSFYNTQDDDTGAAKPWLVPACQDVHMACDKWCCGSHIRRLVASAAQCGSAASQAALMQVCLLKALCSTAWPSWGPAVQPRQGPLPWQQAAAEQFPTGTLCAGKAKDGKMKGEEVAMVQSVTAMGTDGLPGLKKANVVLRIPRPPYIGDKFSSRHGQKGVLSQHYRDADMPFCAATGMRCAASCTWACWCSRNRTTLGCGKPPVCAD